MSELTLKDFSIISFESRMALSVQRQLEKCGAQVLSAPTIKEVPIADTDPAFALYADLKNKKYDVLILLTGVATRMLISTLKERFPIEEILDVLKNTNIFVRGPKPEAVLKQNSIPMAGKALPPHTWQEVADWVNTQPHIKSIAILEYGMPPEELCQSLESDGRFVTTIPIYRWSLPDDLLPLTQAVQNISQGKCDAVLFTSAIQTDHLLEHAATLGQSQTLRRGLQKTVIYSIGPVTSERLCEHQLFPDAQSTPSKIDVLLKLISDTLPELSKIKQNRIERTWVTNKNESKIQSHSLIMRAFDLKPNKTVPIWLMRQAGRYMAEYQLIRKKVDFLTLCKTPDLAAQATITALERLGVDAAIIFSDILLILETLGANVTFNDKEGPRITNPVRDESAIEAITLKDPLEHLPYLFEAIRHVRKAVQPHVPLLGFSGAPFTLASYIIEGYGLRNFIQTKKLMHGNPKAWGLLMRKLVTQLKPYLIAQVQAGCQAVQIFDSWVGCLSAKDYEEFVLPYTLELVAEVQKHAPVIYFGTHSSPLLSSMAKTKPVAMGIDAQTDIGKAAQLLGPETVIQGNLDPVLLFSKPEVFLKVADQILNEVGSRPGFIFNLGHGILPGTPVENVLALIDHVHAWRPAS